MLGWYFKLYELIAARRLAAQDIDPRRIHSHLVIVLGTGILMWAYALLTLFYINSPTQIIIGFACSLVHLLSPLLFIASPNYFMITNIMLGSAYIHQTSFTMNNGGFTSFGLAWYGMLPLLGGIIAGKRSALMWALICIVSAGCFLYLHVNQYYFSNLLSYEGFVVGHALLVFGWIFLSTFFIYVYVMLNESKEKLLAEQGKKIDGLFRVLFHDLAGPLSRISIGLNITKRESDPESKEHGLKIVSKATDSMMEITQNVRRMYAASQSIAGNDLTYFPLNEAVDYVSRIYSDELSKKEIQISYNFQKNQKVKVLVEPVSFKNQVLGNVIYNAIKFSPVKSKITIEAKPYNAHMHTIEIADAGVGMTQEVVNNLFDITKKTSRPGTNGEIGTGFGLHIVKSFMEMFQGQILVESAINHGTKIKLVLKSVLSEGEELPPPR